MATAHHPHVIRSLERGIRLLDAVGREGPARPKQLARATGTPLATTYHLLRTLAFDAYVVRLDDGTYIPGPRLGAGPDATEGPHGIDGPVTERGTDDPDAGPTLIQSLRRGMRLLDTAVGPGPVTARRLSAATSIPLATTHHLLRTLVHVGYLHRAGRGTYTIGHRCREAVRRGQEARRVPEVHLRLRRLSNATSASACLAVLVDAAVTVVHVAPAARVPALDWWPGTTLPIHATALGRCVLAQLPAAQRPRHLPAVVPRLTARTIVDGRRLAAEVEGRLVHHADQQHTYGVSCSALPVVVPGAIAALGLALPSATAAQERAHVTHQLLIHALGLGPVLGEVSMRALGLPVPSDELLVEPA